MNQRIGEQSEVANGAAVASYVAAGIGALVMGLVVFLNEAGVFEPPALYEPAGGVSGRTTIAVVIWLIAWAALHSRWKHREIDASRLRAVTLLLVGLGILLCFPPLWSIL